MFGTLRELWVQWFGKPDESTGKCRICHKQYQLLSLVVTPTGLVCRDHIKEGWKDTWWD